MYSILIRPTESFYEQAIGELWQQGTMGLIEEQGEIRAFFRTRGAAEQAATCFAAQLVSIREEELTSHVRGASVAEPILVGHRFFIVPSSSDIETPPGRIRLSVDSGAAFGSGRHESTQLVLQALETHLAPGMSVVDIGCGSGILSAAARLLGARHVAACDIDPSALPLAQSTGVPVFVGSADAIATATADIVLANISARVVDALASDLHRIAKPDGRVVVSGFVDAHVPSKFRAEKVLRAGEWQCWICRRNDAFAREYSPPLQHDGQWW